MSGHLLLGYKSGTPAIVGSSAPADSAELHPRLQLMAASLPWRVAGEAAPPVHAGRHGRLRRGSGHLLLGHKSSAPTVVANPAPADSAELRSRLELMAASLPWRVVDTHDILISLVLDRIQRATSVAGDTVSRSARAAGFGAPRARPLAAAEIMLFVCAAFSLSVTEVKASAPRCTQWTCELVGPGIFPEKR